MPASKAKNYLYRLALPFFVPRLEAHPEFTVSGSALYTRDDCLHLLRKHHVMGAAVLLRDTSRRSVLLCSSRNPNHPVRENSYFRVASITKMATALAVMIAAQHGKVDLNQPFLSYFQGLSAPSFLNQITLFHLLSHTSGLADPMGLEDALLEGKPFPELLETCSSVCIPGKEFHYSNLGFGLVGCILESVYQLPVSEIFKRLIFDPLKMRATLDASTLNPEDIVPIVRIHRPFSHGNELRVTPLGKIPLDSPDPLRHYGHTAGALYVDLPSLEKLLLCLMRKGAPLVSADFGEEMLRRHAVYGKSSPALSYGLGILRIQDPSISDSVILGHQGFAYGCADGAFWEESTGRMLIQLNGGASEARKGRLGLYNAEMMKWAFRKEMPNWYRSSL